MDESGVGIRAGSGMNLHKLAAHFAIVNGLLTNQINYLVVIYLFMSVQTYLLATCNLDH